jgi:hypothetical protein
MIINGDMEGTCVETVVTGSKGLFRLLQTARYGDIFMALTMLFSCTFCWEDGTFFY